MTVITGLPWKDSLKSFPWLTSRFILFNFLWRSFTSFSYFSHIINIIISLLREAQGGTGLFSRTDHEKQKSKLNLCPVLYIIVTVQGDHKFHAQYELSCHVSRWGNNCKFFEKCLETPGNSCWWIYTDAKTWENLRWEWYFLEKFRALGSAPICSRIPQAWGSHDEDP